MNIKLKDGGVYTDPSNNYQFNKGFGRIRNISFAIESGVMSDPQNFNATGNIIVSFYNDQQTAINGLSPLYSININLSNLELVSILDIDQALGYSISEKKIYDILINSPLYSGLFEIIV